MKYSRRKVAFLMGAGHCGSTLVELILGSHSNAMALGELRKISEVDFSVATPRICKVCQGECRYWNHLAPREQLRRSFKPAGYVGKATHLIKREPWIYSRLADWFHVPVLVDSSKSVNWIDRQLKRRHRSDAFDVYLIYVARDGRAVTNSYLRRYPDRGMDAITREWVGKVQQMEPYFAAFEGGKFQLRYEDLCADPASAVKKLCGLMEIDYQPSMLDYWKFEHHPVGGNAGTRSLLTAGQHSHSGSSQFYESLGETPSIRLDLRWRQELSPENVAIFERLAGDVNRPYSYDD